MTNGMDSSGRWDSGGLWAARRAGAKSRISPGDWQDGVALATGPPRRGAMRGWTSPSRRAFIRGARRREPAARVIETPDEETPPMTFHRILPALTLLLALTAGAARAEDMPEAPKKAKNDLSATLEANERGIQESIKRRDMKAFSELVDPDAWMTDASGIMPAMHMAGMMKDMEIRSYSISDFRTLPIDRGISITVYTWSADASYQGQAYPAGPYYCSTVWRKHGNDWKAVYHQETIADASAPAMTP
jgi:hypothetical protein